MWIGTQGKHGVAMFDGRKTWTVFTEEDLEKLNQSLDEIAELMQKSHRVFLDFSH
jgi:hypothetical protein